MDQHSHAAVKLEVELRTTLNCYACDRDINTPIKPQCLCNKKKKKNAAIMLKGLQGDEIWQACKVLNGPYSWLDAWHYPPELACYLHHTVVGEA
jgi:hypothetical protein